MSTARHLSRASPVPLQHLSSASPVLGEPLRLARACAGTSDGSGTLMGMRTTAGHGHGTTGADAGARSWPRLHWRDRAQVRSAGVSRARWTSLGTATRAEVLATVRELHPAPATRGEGRAVLHGPVGEVLPPDHPQQVLARGGRRAAACYRRAEAETPADATATDDQRAALETAEGYHDGLSFFDELTTRLLSELGESDRRAASHRRSVAVDAHALALREGAERRAEHLAAALVSVVLLILAALDDLAEHADQDTGTGPEAPRPEPPPPPPSMLALVRSTLTAAPPQGTVSVPSPCCALSPLQSAA